jgi:calcium-dependent protein kinase
LDHPGILKIFEVFQSPSHLYIVTELCTGGELFDRIKDMKKFSENQAARCMMEIVAAVMHCNQLGIVHRDLKPENIMYENKEREASLKIIDFGTSQIYNKNSKMKKVIGTYVYMAPEVISAEYDEKCDVWSLGVILYIMLSGMPPFGGRNDQEIASRIQNAPLNFTHSNWLNVSEEAKTLVMNMLKKNPVQRISIEEVFNDPWVQSRGHNKIPDKEIEEESLKSLASFKTHSMLQKAVYSFIVSQMLDSEFFLTLKGIFLDIDKNGDGLLSIEEIQEAAKKVSFVINVQEIIKECDTDKNGFINYTEFLTATVDRSKAYSKSRIREVFNMFDKNHDGKIDLDELKLALGGEHNNESALLKIIQEADSNMDGEIDFEEFLAHVGQFS